MTRSLRFASIALLSHVHVGAQQRSGDAAAAAAAGTLGVSDAAPLPSSP